MENKLRGMILLFALVAIVGLVVILPYRLYSRDTDLVQQHVRVVSDELALVSHLVKLTMLNVKEEKEPDSADDDLKIINKQLQELYSGLEQNESFQFRIVRSPSVEKQYSKVAGRGADLPHARQVLESGRPVSSVEDAIFTNWSPITASNQCGFCHVDEQNAPIAAGTTLGVVETRFDLTRERERSNRTIFEITGFLIAMIVVMALINLIIVRKSLVNPIRELVDALDRRSTDPDVPLPNFSTREMSALVAAIDKQSKVDPKRDGQDDRG